MQQLKKLIRGEIGRNVVWLNVTDSTNSFAMELVEKGASHGTVVIADSQTKGRGRRGRAWISPPGGNIYMSVILTPSMGLRKAPLLTIMAGVACCTALRNTCGLPVEIRWPNDLMVSRKKLGGILTEIKSSGDKIVYAVMGIGINVSTRVEDFPPEVGMVATSIRIEKGKTESRTLLMAEILNELDRWYRVIAHKEENTLLNEWRRLTSMLGRLVEVTMGDEIINGRAHDIDDEGMLIVKLSSGSLKRISFGDLVVLR
ncbi:MAG TPA: biotin--[acetyl-CoA-carboxylase] ligase [Thermodesulfovibrionales bacterium]|nr:biotin--[acetyl-CoA-carboxylase] ligase [Thermodesulfovibrionales bacterium]